MRETFNIDKVEKDQGHKYIDLNPPMCTGTQNKGHGLVIFVF